MKVDLMSEIPQARLQLSRGPRWPVIAGAVLLAVLALAIAGNFLATKGPTVASWISDRVEHARWAWHELDTIRPK